MDAKRRREYRDEMQKRDITSPPPDKREYGARVQSAVEKFLERGGVIKRIPTAPRAVD